MAYGRKSRPQKMESTLGCRWFGNGLAWPITSAPWCISSTHRGNQHISIPMPKCVKVFICVGVFPYVREDLGGR
jgi:hypothetical protein